MKTLSLTLVVITLGSFAAFAQKDDGGFHTLTEWMAMGGTEGVENVDDIFDLRGIAQKLAAEKRVRIFRFVAAKDHPDVQFGYELLRRRGTLRDRLGKDISTREVAEKDFRPVLQLAGDFNNYGGSTLCEFETGVALILGGDEPSHVMMFCFKCHEAWIIRRPTYQHPKPRDVRLTVSPEFEEAAFALTRAAYPDDKDLQSFQLEKRHRSKTPLK